MSGAPVRTLAVCCERWPTVAAGLAAATPAIVVHANRVVSLTPAAAADGVSVGLRRRESQARCPSVVVHEADPTREARVFEEVLGALDGIAPRWEVTGSGTCAVPALGPARYHGGERRLAELVVATVAQAASAATGLPATEVVVGVAVADGPRAAGLLAREAARDGAPQVVAPGATAAALTPLPVGCLTTHGFAAGTAAEREELADVLRRLGLRNLGRFAALGGTDVLARFGPLGALVHDVARGMEGTRVALQDVPVDLRVSAALDPPADRVDRAAFTAKVLADDLHAELSRRGLACTRVLVVAETEEGDRIERLWRHEGALTAAAVAQRARWQLEGWLGTGVTRARCRGGVSRVELVPDEVVPDDGRQLGLWGGSQAARERAVRALARVQALVGAEAVVVPEWRGGRAPGERYRPVPLDTVDPAGRAGPDGRPWPGSLPAPSPAVVWPTPLPAELCDADGRRIEVNGRGLASAAPVGCALDGGPVGRVQAWAGPWCVDERWWDPLAHRRRARMQVVVGHDGTVSAHLLALESGRWWLEASYD